MAFLFGEDIKLEKFSSKFITDEYVGWLNDQDINKYLCVGRMPISIEEIRDYSKDEHNILFAILYKSKYIGTLSINRIDWVNRKAEIGYLIGNKKYWGKGIASITVGLAADYALNRLNLHKVEAGVVDGNIGSVKVLEKNGFKQYGTIPQDHWLCGEYKDSHRFYKICEEK